MVYALPEEVIVTFIIIVLLGELNYVLQTAASIVVVIYALLLYMTNFIYFFTADLICVEIFILIDLDKCVF